MQRANGLRPERKVVWLVGRGITESCGLAWQVPEEWYEAFRRGTLARGELVERIRGALRRAQDEHIAHGRIDTSPIDGLARVLGTAPLSQLQHAFVTTNWDTLLDLALAPYGHRVWHLNGSIDGGELLTELDERRGRDAALTANPGFRLLLEAQACVLAGLSLKSSPDRELVERMGAEQRWRPAGETWLLVNHDPAELKRVAAILRERLPRSRVIPITTPFEEWAASGAPELLAAERPEEIGDRGAMRAKGVDARDARRE